MPFPIGAALAAGGFIAPELLKQLGALGLPGLGELGEGMSDIMQMPGDYARGVLSGTGIGGATAGAIGGGLGGLARGGLPGAVFGALTGATAGGALGGAERVGTNDFLNRILNPEPAPEELSYEEYGKRFGDAPPPVTGPDRRRVSKIQYTQFKPQIPFSEAEPYEELNWANSAEPGQPSRPAPYRQQDFGMPLNLAVGALTDPLNWLGGLAGGMAGSRIISPKLGMLDDMATKASITDQINLAGNVSDAAYEAAAAQRSAGSPIAEALASTRRRGKVGTVPLESAKYMGMQQADVPTGGPRPLPELTTMQYLSPEERALMEGAASEPSLLQSNTPQMPDIDRSVRAEARRGLGRAPKSRAVYDNPEQFAQRLDETPTPGQEMAAKQAGQKLDYPSLSKLFGGIPENEPIPEMLDILELESGLPRAVDLPAPAASLGRTGTMMDVVGQYPDQVEMLRSNPSYGSGFLDMPLGAAGDQASDLMSALIALSEEIPQYDAGPIIQALYRMGFR